MDMQKKIYENGKIVEKHPDKNDRICAIGWRLELKADGAFKKS
jgi:hypothetical protein